LKGGALNGKLWRGGSSRFQNSVFIGKRRRIFFVRAESTLLIQSGIGRRRKKILIISETHSRKVRRSISAYYSILSARVHLAERNQYDFLNPACQFEYVSTEYFFFLQTGNISYHKVDTLIPYSTFLPDLFLIISFAT